MKRAILASFAVMVACLVSSCGGSASMEGMWTDPDYHGDIRNVLTVGLIVNDERRESFETRMATELKQFGFQATAAADAMPGAKLHRATVEQYCKDNAVDAVLVMRLIPADPKQKRTLKDPYSAPRGSYDLYAFYYQAWELVRVPDYLNTKKVRVESNLYRTSDDDLVWSAITETFNLDGISKKVNAICHGTAGSLSLSPFMAKR